MGAKNYERRLSVDWKRIKAEYIAGGTSYRKLAEKYGVSRSKLQAKATSENWVKLKSQTQAKTESKIVESVSTQGAKKAVDLFDIADLLADKVREIAATVSDPDSIKKLTSAIKDLKDIKGIKSEEDIAEQRARIEKLRREAEREDDTTNEIEIVFKAGEEAWNE